LELQSGLTFAFTALLLVRAAASGTAASNVNSSEAQDLRLVARLVKGIVGKFWHGPHALRKKSRLKYRVFASSFFCALALLVSLSCRRQATPNEAFNHAHQLFLQGNFEESQAQAERAYRKFAQSNPRLALRFRILEA